MRNTFLAAFLISILCGVAAAQPFVREPKLSVTTFACEMEDSLISDRDQECEIYIAYLPDTRVGLSQVTLELVADFYSVDDPNRQWQKEILRPVVFSKENGRLEVYSEPPAPYAIRVPFKINLSTQDYNSGILGIGGGYYDSGRRYTRLRAKLTFRFANGIEFKKDTAIRVR